MYSAFLKKPRLWNLVYWPIYIYICDHFYLTGGKVEKYARWYKVKNIHRILDVNKLYPGRIGRLLFSIGYWLNVNTVKYFSPVELDGVAPLDPQD